MNRALLSTIMLAALAIIAFAGNSLLARAALADGAITPGAYSAIRLAAGALVLLPLLGARPSVRDAPGALSLAIYVGGFSLAYVNLSAASGALILFACVQATIILVGLARGERLTLFGGIGIALALAGLGWLLAPGTGAVDPMPGALMAIAGIGWGIYTLVGRSSKDASGSTARNFLLATPLVLPMLLFEQINASFMGALLAAISGAVTSGLGYVVWYKVAPRMGLATVASVQLATPVVAALGGVLLLSEPLGSRLVLAGALILVGIMLTLRKSA